jgi:hypothetical protein
VVPAALETFAEPMGLMDGAARLGDPLAKLPTVFHLLWWGQLQVDLRAGRGHW